MSEEIMVKVPAEMILAVARAVRKECGRCDYFPQIDVALHAAMLWMLESIEFSIPEGSTVTGFGYSLVPKINPIADSIVDSGPLSDPKQGNGSGI